VGLHHILRIPSLCVLERQKGVTMKKKMVRLSDVRMNDLKRRAKIIKLILRHLDAMDREIARINKGIYNIEIKTIRKIAG
jgi:hypothetical protein